VDGVKMLAELAQPLQEALADVGRQQARRHDVLQRRSPLALDGCALALLASSDALTSVQLASQVVPSIKLDPEAL